MYVKRAIMFCMMARLFIITVECLADEMPNTLIQKNQRALRGPAGLLDRLVKNFSCLQQMPNRE